MPTQEANVAAVKLEAILGNRIGTELLTKENAGDYPLREGLSETIITVRNSILKESSFVQKLIQII